MRSEVMFPAFLPDQLPRGNVCTVAKNVYPALGGYRAVKGFSSVSESLPEAFLGGFSASSTDGTAYLLAGTTEGLYRLTSGTWATLVDALTIANRWRFAQFGDFVVTVNGDDTREVDLTAGTQSVLTGAPSGTSITVVGDHVVIGQANGDILRVRWSAFGDHTGWTSGTDQAGEQPMLTGGAVMGLAGGEYGVILQRQRLVRMSRTGDSEAPFQFDEITPNFGAASASSIVQAGRTVFFLSDRGFIALDDGQAIRPIGNEKFDRSFRDQIGPDDYERLYAAVDPVNSLVMWGIPGVVGTIWVYNWVLDQASTIELPFNGLFSGFESSVTLEGYSALYPDLDTATLSLDDPRFYGGSPRLYLVDGSDALGVFAGPNLIATLEHGLAAFGGEQVSRIYGTWPITDATTGVTMTMDLRQRLGDTERNVTNAAMQESGKIPLYGKGRYIASSMTINNAAWSYVQGYDVEFQEGGRRG